MVNLLNNPTKRHELGSAARKHLLETYNAQNSETAIKQFYERTIKADHIVINQGDTFDISIHHYPFYELIKQNNISFSLICHNHVQYGDIPQENVYPRAKNIFEQAKNVFFVWKRIQRITERKLCTKLPNGRFTWNPLNLKETNYIPWPENTITQFAVVGNIMSGKGHDTLLECLSAPEWQKRTMALKPFW